MKKLRQTNVDTRGVAIYADSAEYADIKMMKKEYYCDVSFRS